MHLEPRGRIRQPSVDAPVPAEGESIYGVVGRKNVRADYLIDSASGCWIWQKALSRTGYPTGRQYRVYYQRAHGAIPEGWHVHHECGNRACVNPEHLSCISARDHHIEHYLTRRGLTLDDVRDIREAGRQPGASHSEVASRYGISRNTVRNYWIDFTWAEALGEDGPVVTPPVICELDGCNEPAVGTYRNKRFCSVPHRQRFNHLKRKPRRKVAA